MKRLQLASRWRSLALAAAAMTLLAGGADAQTPVPAVGLSTVRAQKFGNENLLGFYTPQAQDQFGWSLATGDFNGDGADDLATGMPFDDGLTDSPIADSGSVVVRYGVPGAGLRTNLADAVLRQTPAVDPPEEGDRYGNALASCDFNGDGFDDLAVGIPHEDHVGRESTGGVQIHFGGANGLPTSGQQFYAESTTGMPGDADDFDHFGWSLACGDFNADGFDDLAIGIPGNDRPNGFGALGMVDIVPGTPSGLDPTAATNLTQDTSGMGGDGEPGDYFGDALAVGDFDGDGFDDLAVGSTGEDDGKGAIHVVFGGRGGLTPAGSQFWMETFLGGSSEDYDYFGSTLASADFDGDGFDDLAIGIPWDDIGAVEAEDAGWIGVLFGADTAEGFDLSRNQFLSEDHIWNAVMAEPDDFFGFSFAAGDFDRDGRADLAVGHPFETLAGPETGAVTILMGTANGLSNAEGIANARDRIITAGADGFPGELTQAAKWFAFALTSGDFDADGHADLAIGAPREDVDGFVNVGTETVLYGALFADGVDNGDATLWSAVQTSPTSSLEVTKLARLGPLSSKVGLQMNLGVFSRTVPSTVYVRVGPERGFHDERSLKGTFFVDPQHVTMTQADAFTMVSFRDGTGAGSKPRLTFDLHRNDALGGWAVAVSSWNDNAGSGGSLQFVTAVAFVGIGDPDGHNVRLDFEWNAGNPGHLRMWRTRFVGGVPDAAGRVLFVDVNLPGAQSAVVNHVLAGMVTGQDPNTAGQLYLDELSFRR